MGLTLTLVSTTASSQEAKQRLTPAEIARMAKGGAGAGTSGVSGIQTTVLAGDPTMRGPYTIEIRVPAHTHIAAHRHRHRDDRSAVIVSGTWYFGYGAKADATLTKALGPGSFYTEPSNEPHFALTRDFLDGRCCTPHGFRRGIEIAIRSAWPGPAAGSWPPT